MKVGKLTDYAIAVMGQLVHAEAGVAQSANELAAVTRIPEPTVAKVLKTLSKGGMVISLRGVAGGYRLARAAEDITLADIITAMEGPISLVACVDGQHENCLHSRTCPTQSKWDRVNGAVKTALAGIPLTEMISAPRRKFVELKGIHVNRA